MKDFDIAKYLKEHNLGSYGILNHYVDLKPLKEEDDTTEVELNTEIPYEGPEHQLTGLGDSDEFEQAETVSEDYEGLVNQLDLRKIAEAVEGIIEDLEADGYHPEEIQEFLIDKVKEAFRPYMK